MTRPVYEQDEDVSNQAFVASELEQAWRVDLFPMPKLCPVDFLAHRRGSTVFKLIEVKCRKNHSSKYPSLILSKAKVDCAEQLARTLGMQFVLVVRWTDGIFCRPVSREHLIAMPVAIGGRVDRADRGDVEPVFHFPVASFKKIGET
jgi:hypothetical protein